MYGGHKDDIYRSFLLILSPCRKLFWSLCVTIPMALERLQGYQCVRELGILISLGRASQLLRADLALSGSMNTWQRLNVEP